jgi:hypothetical protein
MSDAIELSPEELALLRSALDAPVTDRRPWMMHLCLRLSSRRLLQRAGGIACANGWRGSPQAFVLTREGWALLKAEHRRAPLRRAS